MAKNYDFCGWATKNDLRCSDGRTIRKDAFKDCDGKIVPLVWNHQHNESANVLGHALLENREEGVYTYGTFNDTESGQNAKLLVEHGDILALSIYANKLKQNGGDVLHGAIREVSLVLAGANPGAFIDSVMVHGESSEDEAIIYTGELLDLSHSDDEDEKEDDVETTEDDKKKDKTKTEESEDKTEDSEDKTDDSEVVEHADSDTKEKKDMADNERTVQDVFDEFTDEQKNVVYFMIGQALEDAGAAQEGDNADMSHNIFEGDVDNTEVLSHSDMEAIFTDAKKFGSLKQAVEDRLDGGTLSHAVTDDDGNVVTYGIANIDYLFPEAKTVGNEPDFIMRHQEWVSVVMGGVHHTPFSRIKSVHANITMDEARAKGYIKGKQKKEEVFPLLKRTTTPQTVYKKQKLDKDDIDDIVDMDVVAWIKKEMRIMLDEELARAFLIGDGREVEDEDKINPQHIRPIWGDAELYTISKHVILPEDATYDEKCNAIIDEIIVSDEDYEGSGNKILFTDKWFVTRSLLMRNQIGERLYKSQAELASELGVNRIVPVPVMKNQTRVVDGVTRTLVGIIVDLKDYNVGADHGSKVDMFDDFDIDFNQYKYLIETRCSGALVKPYSAVTVEMSFQ